MGTISAALTFTKNGAVISIDQDFHTSPSGIVLHIPYFAELLDIRADTWFIQNTDSEIMVGPDVSEVAITWKIDELPELSFDVIVDEFKQEYARRFADYTAQGQL